MDLVAFLHCTAEEASIYSHLNRWFRDDTIFLGKFRETPICSLQKGAPQSTGAACRAALDLRKLQHILDSSTEVQATCNSTLITLQTVYVNVMLFVFKKKNPWRTHIWKHCLRWSQNLLVFDCYNLYVAKSNWINPVSTCVGIIYEGGYIWNKLVAIIYKFVSNLFVRDRRHCGRDV